MKERPASLAGGMFAFKKILFVSDGYRAMKLDKSFASSYGRLS